MKPVKFIVFADAKTHCEKPGDNFLQQDLKLEYGAGQTETAICIKQGEAKNLSIFNDLFDIYLFNDTFSKPQSGSIFFKEFIGKFHQNRDKIDLKIILHKTSNWNFHSFETAAGKFFAKYADEISWLQSFKENENWIYQSHISNGVYCRELKEIAKAIIEKNKNDYEKAVRSLNGRFTDKQFEDFLKPFEKIVPLLSGNQSQDSKIIKAKEKLKTHLQLQ
jgi:hypothetical protein